MKRTTLLLIIVLIVGCRSPQFAPGIETASFTIQGDYEGALKRLQVRLAKAKAKAKEEGRTFDREIGEIYLYMAQCYIPLGQNDKAVEVCTKGLSGYKKIGEANDQTDLLRKSLIQAYTQLELYDKALVVAENGFRPRTYDIHRAEVYRHKGKYRKAIKYYQSYKENQLSQPYAEMRFTDIYTAEVEYLRGNYEQAAKFYKKAYTKMTKLVDDAFHNAHKQMAELEKLAPNIKAQMASRSDTMGRFMEDVDRDLVKFFISLKLGISYYRTKQYSQAISYIKQSTKVIEKIRAKASPEKRRDYLAKEVTSYEFLIACYIKQKNYAQAFRVMELSRARVLAERLKNTADISVPGISNIQNSISRDTAVLAYANTGLQSTYYKNPDIANIQIVITQNALRGQKGSGYQHLQRIATKYESAIQSSLKNHRGLTLRITETKRNKNWQLKNLVNYYRKLLSSPKNDRQIKEVARALYSFLVKPMAKHLDNKKKLIIMPDGVLNFLPFETLIDDKGRYLAEIYDIEYIPSMAVANLINNRNYQSSRKPLLAFGGAIYNQSSYQSTMAKDQMQLAFLKQVVARGSHMGKTYQSLGIKWSNLPGTLGEVKNIAKIVKNTHLLTGEQVTENKIKAMSQNGQLSKYRVVHFATHGMTLPELPELSAIVLSQLKSQQEDGYLRMEEIAKLNLKADFVNLSACETGLGKIYGGEGAVGLAQSFLIAGANGLSVSLWQVHDLSTMLFMVGMYQLVKEKNLSYKQAMAQMKRAFIQGKVSADSYNGSRGLTLKYTDNPNGSKQFAHPFYWAPFIYYGK